MNIFTLAKCYATLANDGSCNDVAFIKNIYSEKGLIYSRELDETRVFQGGANYLMTDMLVNTVNTGTAKLLNNNKFEVAAKTGTVGNSNGNSDALVAGYTTENTFVVWYSGDLLNSVNGSSQPCKFASTLLGKMYAESKPQKFVAPNSVVQLDIDKDSLENEQLIKKCDMGLKFWFDKANQPKETLQKIVYNYALETSVKGNVISVKLPEVENGIWQLYAQKDGNENATKLDIKNNIYTGEIQEDTEFYAELFVNNKPVARAFLPGL